MKDAEFWDPKKLFVPAPKMDRDWYRAKFMKPNDVDHFGDKNNF